MTPEEAASVKPGALLCPDHGDGPALCRSGDVVRCGIEGCGQSLVVSPDPASEIVRELARSAPPENTEGYVTQCAFCDIRLDYALGEDVSDPLRHEPSCLWRRAKALYPDDRG